MPEVTVEPYYLAVDGSVSPLSQDPAAPTVFLWGQGEMIAWWAHSDIADNNIPFQEWHVRDEALVVMNACDPVNLYGPASDALGSPKREDIPRTAAGEPLAFSRIPSTWLVQHRGLPVLVAEDTGARLTTVQGASEGLVRRALRALLDHLASFEHRVTVQTWNGAPVLGGAGQQLLESVGFYRDYPGMTWERR